MQSCLKSTKVTLALLFLTCHLLKYARIMSYTDHLARGKCLRLIWNDKQYTCISLWWIQPHSRHLHLLKLLKTCNKMFEEMVGFLKSAIFFGAAHRYLVAKETPAYCRLWCGQKWVYWNNSMSIWLWAKLGQIDPHRNHGQRFLIQFSIWARESLSYPFYRMWQVAENQTMRFQQ